MIINLADFRDIIIYCYYTVKFEIFSRYINYFFFKMANFGEMIFAMLKTKNLRKQKDHKSH